jgi:high-affinity iron transporter
MEEFIITFRESLEAALIIGIIFSYLKKTKKIEFYSFVYFGIGLGIASSLLAAYGFHQLAGGFTGLWEQIFEGVTMFLGASLIVYLIAWMADKKDASSVIKSQVDKALNNSGIGIMMLVFLSILREGVETVLFLNTIVYDSTSNAVMLAFFGVIGGLLVGYSVYRGLKGMNLKYLFSVSSILLMLFATGLFARSIHEFQEFGLIPTFVSHIWDINYVLNENNLVGSFMKSLFGYNANPSLLEVFMYCASLFFMIILYNRATCKFNPRK